MTDQEQSETDRKPRFNGISLLREGEGFVEEYKGEFITPEVIYADFAIVNLVAHEIAPERINPTVYTDEKGYLLDGDGLTETTEAEAHAKGRFGAFIVLNGIRPDTHNEVTCLLYDPRTDTVLEGQVGRDEDEVADLSDKNKYIATTDSWKKADGEEVPHLFIDKDPALISQLKFRFEIRPAINKGS